jgi:hypothetical protein
MPPGSKATVYDRDPTKNEFDEWLIRVICYQFGLSPAAFVKETNRATATVTQEAGIAETHKANLRWLAGFLTSIITAAWGPGLEWRWNLSSDPTLDQTIQILATGALKPSVLTRFGFQPEEIADALPSQAAAEQPKEALPAKAEKPPKKVDQKNGHVHEVENGDMLNASPEFVQFMSTYLDELRTEALSAGQTAYKANAVVELDDDPGFVLRAVPHLREAYRGGVERGVSVVAGGPGSAAITESEAQAFARERAAWMVGRKWVDGKLVDNPNAEYAISNVVRDELRSTISKAFEDHLTPNQLAEQIADASGFSPARALNIARTETANAQGEGKLDYFRASGIERKEWTDSDGCPDCVANAEQGPIPIDDEFQSGDDHEPAHPGCRCAVVPA